MRGWINGGSLVVAVAAALGGLNAPAPAQDFFGLSHQALGKAQLSESPDGNLVVSNIGSSGKDGVSIDVGDVTGFEMLLDIGPAGALNADQCTYIYKPYDWRNGCIYVKESGGTGSAIMGVEGTGAQPACVRVELFLNDVLVDSRTYPGQSPATLVSGDFGSDPVTGECMILSATVPVWIWRLPNPELLTLTDSPSGPVSADRVAISLDGLPPGEYYVGQVDVVAANMASGSLTIDGEALLIADQAHGVAALEDATMTGVCESNICAGCPECCPGGEPRNKCYIKISNLGSSGCDGFSIALPPDDECGEFTMETSRINLPDGDDEFEMEALGLFDGGPEQLLGTCALRHNQAAATVELLADFTSIGTDEVTVEVRDNGVLQGTVVLQGGPGVVVANINPGPAGLGINKCGKQLPDPPCFFICTEEDFTFFGGGEVHTGDDLRVLATGAIGSIDDLCRYRCYGTSIDDVFVTVSQCGSAPPVIDSSGLPHSPEGQAQLSTSPSGNLVVSNIGSSGKDGVRFVAGEGQAMLVELADNAVLAPDGSYTVEVEGLTGPDHRRFGTMCELTGTGDARASMAFPMSSDPDTLTVELLGRDDKCIVAFNMPDTDDLMITGNPGSSFRVVRFKAGADLSRAVNLAPPGEPVSGINVSLEQIPGALFTVTHPTEGTFNDVASLRVTTPSEADARVTAASLRVAGTPQLEVVKTALVQFDNGHVGVGDAELRGLVCDTDPLESYVQVALNGDTGASGGFRIDYLDVDSDNDGIPDIDEPGGACVVIDSFDVDQTIQDFLWRQLSGPAAMLPDDEAASMTLNLDPGGASRTVNVGPLLWMAPESLEARVYSASGHVVSVATGLTVGDVATSFVPDLPGTYEFQLTVSDNLTAGSTPDGAIHRVVWDSDVDLQLTGQATVTGRELRVIATPGKGAVVDPVDVVGTEVTTQTTATAGMTIVDEQVEHLIPPCPGDLDGDDDTDQSDLGILLAAYLDNANGDLDGDGDTDQSDLGILLADYLCGTTPE